MSRWRMRRLSEWTAERMSLWEGGYSANEIKLNEKFLNFILLFFVQKTQAPCSEEIGPCGNTCQKMLACEMHICVERCHKGNCGPCLEITKKECRCGAHSKELPCTKMYMCDTKCKQMRDCNKHACNRKVGYYFSHSYNGWN